MIWQKGKQKWEMKKDILLSLGTEWRLNISCTQWQDAPRHFSSIHILYHIENKGCFKELLKIFFYNEIQGLKQEGNKLWVKYC